MILDVGCGNHPRGDVNCDLITGENPHLTRPHNIVNPKTIPNFVKCDICYLPFKSNLFEEVVSYHVLEHVEKPTKGLLELLRVADHKVTFVVPHRVARNNLLGRYTQGKFHKRFFNVTNIKEWLTRFNLNFEIEMIYRWLPFYLVPIFRLPWSIKVTIHKPSIR